MINDVHENVLDGNVRSLEYDFLMWYDPAGAEVAHVRVQLALRLKLWSVHVRSRRSGLLARMGLWKFLWWASGEYVEFWGGTRNKTILRNNLDKCMDAIYSLYHRHLLSASDSSRTDTETDRTESISPNLTDWPQPLQVSVLYQSKFSVKNVLLIKPD